MKRLTASLPGMLRAILPYLLPVAAACLFRLYRITETIRFKGDQGMDLTVVWYMQHAAKLPIIGPPLSLETVITPPTYYYVTWLFYAIGKSITGVVAGYFVMNMVTMFILMRIGYEMAGKRASILIGWLFAVSYLMVEHGRQFWQPYPMQVFLALFLYFLWRAFATKQAFQLWLGVVSFFVALSVYPSPALIIPYLAFQVFRWYREALRFTKGRAALYAILTIILPAAAVFSPQLVFVAIRGSVPSPVVPAITFTMTHADSLLQTIGENVFYLIFGYLQVYRLFPLSSMYIVVPLLFLYLTALRWTDIRPGVRAFFSPPALLLGLVFFLFYSKDIYDHRSWSYLPFLFLFTGMTLDRMLARTAWAKAVACLFIMLYTVFNLTGVAQYFNPEVTNEKEEAKQIGVYIAGDMRKRNLTQYDTGFFHKVPNDLDNSSYSIYRVLYWLLEVDGITIPLVKEGNIPDFDYSHPVIKPYMYIMCLRFQDPEEAERYCIQPTLDRTPYDILATKLVGRTYVFTLRIPSR